MTTLQEIQAEIDSRAEILSPTDRVTADGRPIFKNQFGQGVSERTITVDIDGKFINVPTVFEGRFLSQDEAVQKVLDAKGADPITGRQLKKFDSIDEAVSAAKNRSNSLGRITAQDIDAEIQRRQEAAFDPNEALQDLSQGDASPVINQLREGFNRVAEPAATLATGALSLPLSGIAGTAQALNPFADDGAGAGAVEATQEALTFSPKTEEGQESLQAIGDFVAPAVEGLESAKSTLGDSTLEATDSPLLATIAFTAPEAAIEIAGVLTGLGFVKRAGNRSAVKTAMADKIKEGTTDTKLAKYIVDGSGNLVNDKFFKEAVKQGIDPGTIAVIKGSTRADRLKMSEMLRTLKRTRSDRIAKLKTRPSDIVGSSMMERFNFIKRINRQAGLDIDRAARKLAGEDVNLSQPVNDFANQLDNLGIKIVDKNGSLVPDFKDSVLAPGERGAIKEVIRQMDRMSKKPIDALAAHKLKRIIDNNVTFGKVNKKLGRDATNALKSFRRDIDIVLDSNFPSYNKANTRYADTIEAISNFQDVAGKKTDLSGKNANKSVGTLLRRLESNAQGRIPLIDSIDEIEKVASKYGAKFQDSLDAQVIFADELNSRFKPAASTSFQGEIGKETSRAARTSKAAFVIEKGGALIDKALRVTDENAIKALEQLLSR